MEPKLRPARAAGQAGDVVCPPRPVQVANGWVRRGGLLAAALAQWLIPCAAEAETTGASSWVRVDGAALRLLAAGPAGGRERDAAFEMRLDPGTLTYWRLPGDAGLPPRFDTHASTNVAAVAVEYPAPALMEEDGAQLFGYRDEVSFPLRVTVGDPSRPSTLVVTLDAAVCRSQCVPVNATVSLPLPAATDASVGHALEVARATVPRRVAPDAPGALAIRQSALTGGAAPTLTVALHISGAATLFTEGPEGWVFAAVPVTPDGANGPTVAVPILQKPDGPLPESLPLTFTLAGATGAIEVPIRVDATPPRP